MSESILPVTKGSGSNSGRISSPCVYAGLPKTPKGKRTPIRKTGFVKIHNSGIHNHTNEVGEREESNIEASGEIKQHFRVGSKPITTLLDAPSGTESDVRDNATRTQEGARPTWAYSPSPEREEAKLLYLSQYPMTLHVIDSPLSQYQSSQEFAIAIRDAMIGTAHDNAYFKAKILHCDIAVWNIRITEDEEGISCGLLIDWDMSVEVDEGEKVARCSMRTGTWQFMSAALLDQSDWHPELEDDRESALWVLLWTALRYTKHATSDSARLTRAFDEVYADGTGNINGGIGKRDYLTTPTKLNPDGGHPQLVALIENLCKVFFTRYRNPPSSAEFKRLDRALEQGLFMEILGDTLAFKYRDHMKKLKARNWLVETFDMFLNAG